MNLPASIFVLLTSILYLCSNPCWGLSLDQGVTNRSPARTHDEADKQYSDRIKKTVGNHAVTRRSFGSISTATISGATIRVDPSDARQGPYPANMILVKDPDTYEAVFYAPPPKSSDGTHPEKLPLLLILPGAGQNDQDAWSLADPQGEHRGLAPSLFASNQAPSVLYENFCVLAPYPAGKRSFYEEPRSKLLSFLNWALGQEGGAQAGIPVDRIDTDRLCLFGFSDGATLAVELATTQRFRAVVVAAYGFTGTLPSLALQRLANVPIWVFHSADDVIYPVRYSDNLVKSLRSAAGTTTTANDKDDLIRYTRYSKDPEGCTGSVQGHCVGITASKSPAVYEWMLQQVTISKA